MKDIEEPKLWQMRLNGGQTQITINLITDTSVADDGVVLYEYDSILLPLGIVDYGGIVAAIIRNKYSDDEMQAIINNYLLDEKNNKEEFDEMQKYRTFAKNTARQIIDELNNNLPE